MNGSGYEIRESTRARRLGITVHPDGRVVVTKPVQVSVRRAEAFAEKSREWIGAVQEKFRRKAEKQKKSGMLPLELPRPRKGSKAYKEAVASARALTTERLAHFNRLYGFRYGTISIRNQKTRWGSCSATGNLSFNYKIAFLPPMLADYVIVHELCHTKEHNHSERFWAQVARAIPEHKECRKRLRAYMH